MSNNLNFESTPVKPPRRGDKYSKDTTGCGLLVSVIKTLDASETNEQRENEKKKIEKEYKKSDLRLNELVSKNDRDLTQVMLLFGRISSEIISSRERIHVAKENLQACKKLLRCRRAELKKLWTDAIQQKYVLEMLDQINELRTLSVQLTAFLDKKHYLHATKLLMSAIELSAGSLKDVEGLNDLRQDLESKKNILYSTLIVDLSKHIYEASVVSVVNNFYRQNSTRNSGYINPFQRNILRKSAERVEANTKVKRALFEIAQNGYVDIDKSEIIEDMELLDPEINSTYFIGIIIECFALLKKVPESIESIKVGMQHELLEIVTRTTHHIMSMDSLKIFGEVSTPMQNNSTSPILDLFDLLFKQFKLISDAHKLTLKNYSNVMRRYNVNFKTYDLNDFWNQAQAVFQLVLTDYLDIQNTSNAEMLRINYTEQNTNVNAYFSRRKVLSKKYLFKFDKSSHMMTHEDHQFEIKKHTRNLSNVSDPRDEHFSLSTTNIGNNPGTTGINRNKFNDNKKRKFLVCEPDSALVRQIYLPMMGYINEIEDQLKCKLSQPSSLNAFLSNYVKETFLARGHNRNLQLTIESLSKTQDAWRTIITPEEMKRLGLLRPLLQSTVMVENRITETKKLIQDLPNHSEELLKMVCSLLKTYRETCQAAYRGIVQPETEDKRIYSVAWLKDEDITRFLKTLPNWTDLKSSNSRTKQRKIKTEPSEDESPLQIQQRNVREAEMLTSNLGESGISHHEILSDIGVLKELSILQESMEWFSNQITDFANELRKPMNNLANNSGAELANTAVIKEGTIKVLINLALEFDELANTCLLVLHLEVRVQCFHYLRSNSSDKMKENDPNKSDSLEPDAKVLKLTKVLSEMDEALAATLHPRKTKYIFEGLAHLAARILIMASNSMESIDTSGVQRMCRNAMALQQTLSSITASREIALDHARSFYEMFYMDADDILNSIVERGAQFTELQYLNALQLICKSRGKTDQNTIAAYQRKLSDILGIKPTLGVTV